MYLNKSSFWLKAILYGGLTCYFGLMSLMIMFSMLLIGTNQVKSSTGIPEESALILATFLIFFVLFGRKALDVLRTSRISKLLDKDKDGLVQIGELSKKMKMKQTKFVSLFVRSIRKGMLINCGLYAVDPSYIILGNGARTIREKFRVMKCNTCGATNVNRIGFENSCKYCGNVKSI